jgi:LuxR family maltose regulon positive regulatory protein
MHLVIVTRADPPLPLARLRARGQLNELRQTDLRFTSAEAADLLQHVLSGRLSPPQITVLNERTEGWIAGLQMAALALQERTAEPDQAADDAEAFVQAFSGTHRHVLDYLVEEVLNRQPAHVQRFLLETSILERLCGPLCEAVVSRPMAKPSGGPGADLPSRASAAQITSGQQMLEELERANLFIAPLDDRREWYRYHRLFADLLHQRLHAGTTPDLPADQRVDIARLHKRAAGWFEAQGMLPEAIHHAFAVADFEGAAGLIEEAAPLAWKQGEVATLLHWMDKLPETTLRAHPLLCVYSATVLLIRATSFARVELMVRMASENDPHGGLRGEIAVLRALLALYHGEIASGLVSAREALQWLPEASVFRGLANRALSALCLMSRDLASAQRLLEEDVAASELAGDRLGASASLRRLGSLAFYRGELRNARAFYQRALEMSRDAHGRLWPVAGRVLTHLGELALESNELEESEGFLSEALELLNRLMPGWNVGSYLALARLRQARGDETGAHEALDAARSLARTTETPMDDVYLGIQEARLALTRGDIASAQHWASQWSARGGEPSHPQGHDVEAFLRSHMFEEMEHATLARLHLAQSQPDQALAVLEPLMDESSGRSALGNPIELLVLRALAYLAQGHVGAALSDLEHALSLAGPEGFVRIFIDEGEPMRRLLREAIQRGAAQEYAFRLLAAFGEGPRPRASVPAEAAAVPAPVSLVEALTEREMEVLRLLRTSMTTPEIANELGIAPSTVRTFVKNLYGKLGAHRRLEAIERAEELGLLRA